MGSPPRGRSRSVRLAALALWALALGATWWIARERGSRPAALLVDGLERIAERPEGPLLLLALYAARPLLLLPITALTVFSGWMFGPWMGFVYAMAAMLGSSSLAYGIGRAAGGSAEPPAAAGAGPDPDAGPRGRRSRLARALRERPFDAVLTSRLLFVPGDLVNYASGALRIPFAAFLSATALGGAPGLATGVLAGASIEGAFRFQGLRPRPALLAASLALLVASLAASAWLRRREARRERARDAAERGGASGPG